MPGKNPFRSLFAFLQKSPTPSANIPPETPVAILNTQHIHHLLSIEEKLPHILEQAHTAWATGHINLDDRVSRKRNFEIDGVTYHITYYPNPENPTGLPLVKIKERTTTDIDQYKNIQEQPAAGGQGKFRYLFSLDGSQVYGVKVLKETKTSNQINNEQQHKLLTRMQASFSLNERPKTKTIRNADGTETQATVFTTEIIQRILPGQAYHAYLLARPMLTDAEIYADANQIAISLQSFHDRNIIHRDMKPHNLIRDPETGQIQLCDLDLTQMLPINSKQFRYTGTNGYRAPELFLTLFTPSDHHITKFNQYAGKAADIYAYGMTLLLNILPKASCFSDQTYQRLNKQIEQFVAIVREDPTSHLQLSCAATLLNTVEQITRNEPASAIRPLVKLCAQCLQPNPIQRPSISQVLNQINNRTHTTTPDDDTARYCRIYSEQVQFVADTIPRIHADIRQLMAYIKRQRILLAPRISAHSQSHSSLCARLSVFCTDQKKLLHKDALFRQMSALLNDAAQEPFPNEAHIAEIIRYLPHVANIHTHSLGSGLTDARRALNQLGFLHFGIKTEATQLTPADITIALNALTQEGLSNIPPSALAESDNHPEAPELQTPGAFR